ncbi:MAG: S4 domain-containing protein, partial [Methylosarcina sp.]
MKNRKQAKNSPKRSSEHKVIHTAKNKNDDALAIGERIQKVLARGGLGSRREIERWITEGRVKINGTVIGLGARLQAGDHLQINERVVHWQKFTRQPTRVLIYH